MHTLFTCSVKTVHNYVCNRRFVHIRVCMLGHTQYSTNLVLPEAHHQLISEYMRKHRPALSAHHCITQVDITDPLCQAHKDRERKSERERARERERESDGL